MNVANAATRTGVDFGPYRVLSRLASGGMADVWLVETSKFGAPMRVVLKTMRPEMAPSSELSDMFVEGALVAAKLRHENVVRVLDVGSIDGRHYIAMEYVRGCTLRQIAQRYHEQQKRFDAWFLLRVVLGVCTALEYVHGYVDEEGLPLALVHGDVSPENVMVSFSGVVKLVDFGVARSSKPARDREGAIVVGKPWYMAPERVRSATVDGRSDLYSLGVILYEYLTGYRPYSGSTESELLARVLEGRPAPPEEFATGISKSLAAATLRALARDPGERFPSASHLASELGARLREIDPQALQWPLDSHMARLFGDREPVPSSVRLAPKGRGTHESELPTAPSDPSVLRAALALLDDEPRADAHATNATAPPRKRSGMIRAHPSPPPLPSSLAAPASPHPIGVDLFAQAPRRPAADVFGGRWSKRTSSTPSARQSEATSGQVGHATESERKAARLFEEGLAAASLGELQRALEAWSAAVELAPTQRLYEANLRRLEKRMGSQWTARKSATDRGEENP
jgi:eukaryotic-like serine/threonine-protein kinase